MRNPSKEVLGFIFSSAFSILLVNLGAIIIKDFPEKPYLGIIKKTMCHPTLKCGF